MWKIATGFGLALAALCAAARAQSGFQNPDPIKAARATLSAVGVPCGDVLGAIRRSDGNLVADCSNGRRYGMVDIGGGKISVVRYNPATGQWASP